MKKVAMALLPLIMLLCISACGGQTEDSLSGSTVGDQNQEVVCTHFSSEWIEDRAATCTIDGSKHRECTQCKEVLETAVINASHILSDWIEDKASTCIAEGSKHKECTVCKKILDTAAIGRSYHTPGDWIEDRAATCTVSGTKHRECLVCKRLLETASTMEHICMKEHILFFGDSITDAGRDKMDPESIGSGFVSKIAKELDKKNPDQYVIINRGVAGNRSADMAARLNQDVICLQPQYVTILSGVNDVWHELSRGAGVSAEDFEAHYTGMVQQLQEKIPGVKIIIMGPFVLPGTATVREDDPQWWPYFEKELPLREEAAKRVAEKFGLIYIPLQEVFDKAVSEGAEAKTLLNDGVHPASKGQVLIAQEWLKAFENINE